MTSLDLVAIAIAALGWATILAIAGLWRASRARGRRATAPPLSDEQRAALAAARCVHCGGAHAVACPRLRRIRFRADGTTPVEVEFWPDAEWPKERVVFPDEEL